MRLVALRYAQVCCAGTQPFNAPSAARMTDQGLRLVTGVVVIPFHGRENIQNLPERLCFLSMLKFLA